MYLVLSGQKLILFSQKKEKITLLAIQCLKTCDTSKKK